MTYFEPTTCPGCRVRDDDIFQLRAHLADTMVTLDLVRGDLQRAEAQLAQAEQAHARTQAGWLKDKAHLAPCGCRRLLAEYDRVSAERDQLRAQLAVLQTDDALHRKYRYENETELEQLRALLAQVRTWLVGASHRTTCGVYDWHRDGKYERADPCDCGLDTILAACRALADLDAKEQS